MPRPCIAEVVSETGTSRVALVGALMAVAAGALLWAPAVQAKLAVVNSVELRARDADIVITGKVLDVRELKTPASEGSKAYREVVIATDLALKGARLKVYRFVDLKRRQHAPKDGAQVLVFLDLAKRHSDVPKSLSRGYVAARMRSYDGSVITLSGLLRRGLPSRSFAMLNDAASVVAAIRAGLQTTGFKAGEAVFDAPSTSAVFKAYYAGSAVRLLLPLDDKTEALAVERMSETPQHLQLEGVAAIAHFPAPANVERVSALRDRTPHARVKEAADALLKRWKRAKKGK